MGMGGGLVLVLVAPRFGEVLWILRQMRYPSRGQAQGPLIYPAHVTPIMACASGDTRTSTRPPHPPHPAPCPYRTLGAPIPLCGRHNSSSHAVPFPQHLPVLALAGTLRWPYS